MKYYVPVESDPQETFPAESTAVDTAVLPGSELPESTPATTAASAEITPPATVPATMDTDELTDLLRQIVGMMEEDRMETETETLFEMESGEPMNEQDRFELHITIQLLILFGIAMLIGAVIILPFWKGVNRW